MAYDVTNLSVDEIDKLEKRIRRMYDDAAKELDQSWQHFVKGYTDSEGNHHDGMLTRYRKEYKAFQQGKYHDPSGKLTDAQVFNRWWMSQEGRRDQIASLYQQMSQRLTDTTLIAAEYVNNLLPGIYTSSYNSISQIAQAAATKQGITGIRFDLIDEYTVKRLMAGSREVRPYKRIEINIPREYHYNLTNIQNAVLRGVLRGDSILNIAKRIEGACNMDRASAIAMARTAVTGARSAGKQDRMEDLASKGVTIGKVWVATEDGRTRPEHAEADGQEVPYDVAFDVGGESLMYPGDPNGSPWNIINCRCTMKTGTVRFHSMLSDEARLRANIRVL